MRGKPIALFVDIAKATLTAVDANSIIDCAPAKRMIAPPTTRDEVEDEISVLKPTQQEMRL
jgi:hypothetical protein